MGWLEDLKKRWVLDRRVNEVCVALRTCARDPARIDSMCQKLRLPESEVRALLTSLHPDASAAPPVRPLVLTKMTQADTVAFQAVEPKGLAAVLSPSEETRPLAERARRLMLMLLDLPVFAEQPAVAGQFVVQLAGAVRAQNGELLRELAEAILEGHRAWLAEPGGPPARRRGPAAVSRVTAPSRLLLEASDHESSPQEADEEDEAGADDWKPVRALLLTIHGDTRVQIEQATKYLESMAVSAGDGAAVALAAEDILVVVRSRIERVTLKLAERSNLTRGLVEQALRVIARHAAIHVRQLRWQLERGASTSGMSQPGQRFPDGVDVAWTALGQYALATLAHTLKGDGPKAEHIARRRAASYAPTKAITIDTALYGAEILALRETTASFVHHMFEQLLEHVVPIRYQADDDHVQDVTTPRPPPVAADVRRLLESPYADGDPELAVELAGELCRNRGAVTWEMCVRLANARAQCHRYVTTAAEELPQWEVALDIQRQADGTLAIPFSIVQQPLSRRFQALFESRDLWGRIDVLWHLVEYAKAFRASILQLGSAELTRHLSLREDELWGRLQTGPAPHTGS